MSITVDIADIQKLEYSDIAILRYCYNFNIQILKYSDIEIFRYNNIQKIEY